MEVSAFTECFLFFFSGFSGNKENEDSNILTSSSEEAVEEEARERKPRSSKSSRKGRHSSEFTHVSSMPFTSPFYNPGGAGYQFSSPFYQSLASSPYSSMSSFRGFPSPAYPYMLPNEGQSNLRAGIPHSSSFPLLSQQSGGGLKSRSSQSLNEGEQW